MRLLLIICLLDTVLASCYDSIKDCNAYVVWHDPALFALWSPCIPRFARAASAEIALLDQHNTRQNMTIIVNVEADHMNIYGDVTHALRNLTLQVNDEMYILPYNVTAIALSHAWLPETLTIGTTLPVTCVPICTITATFYLETLFGLRGVSPCSYSLVQSTYLGTITIANPVDPSAVSHFPVTTFFIAVSVFVVICALGVVRYRYGIRKYQKCLTRQSQTDNSYANLA